MKVRDTGFRSPQSTFEMSAVRKIGSEPVGKRTNLTDVAGGTTKDANDTKSAVHRLASSCSSSSSSSVVLTARFTDDAVVRRRTATLPKSTTGGVADGRFVYHSDALGSVAAITDELQATVRTYTYEAFGKLRATTGTGPVGGNRFTYTAREPLGDSGALYYYRWRVMDPNVGRFTSEDPLGFVDGVNVYVYVSSNPIGNLDPYGLQSWNTPPGPPWGNTPPQLPTFPQPVVNPNTPPGTIGCGIAGALAGLCAAVEGAGLNWVFDQAKQKCASQSPNSIFNCGCCVISYCKKLMPGGYVYSQPNGVYVNKPCSEASQMSFISTSCPSGSIPATHVLPW